MKKQLSAETLRKRKFLMVLPLLVFPFITMAFWALGGGKGMPDKDWAKQSKQGFNTDLPDAKFNQEEKNDKFSLYKISARESANTDEKSGFKELAFPKDADAVDPNEEKINEKLAQITTELNRTTTSPGDSQLTTRIAAYQQSSNIGADVNRLENLMNSLQGGNEDDKEMTQLNSILEKVLEIQNPSRAREKQKEKSIERSTGTFSVHVANGQEEKQSLYALARNIDSRYAENTGNAIEATIHQNQEIVAGSVIKLRLLDSIYVRGTLIPRNEFVYGIASIDDERLKINIPTLRYRNSILPVSLSAFDLDGLEGLYIPGAITREASKKGVEDAVQSLQIMTMDPSVSAQVAGAGVQAAKGLFSRKVKQVRVKLKAGYQLLLRDNSQRN